MAFRLIWDFFFHYTNPPKKDSLPTDRKNFGPVKANTYFFLGLIWFALLHGTFHALQKLDILPTFKEERFLHHPDRLQDQKVTFYKGDILR